MKTLEIICGIVAGGILITWILYLAVRCLGNARQFKDDLDREYYREHDRHIYDKK